MEANFMRPNCLPTRSSRSTLLFALGAFAAFVFTACQSTSPSPAAPSGPEDRKLEFSDSVYTDTMKWVRGTESGTAAVSLKDSTAGANSTRMTQFQLKSPLGTGTMELSVWTLGVRTGRVTGVADAIAGYITFKAGSYQRDTLGRALISYFASRTKSDTSLRFTRQKLIEVYAKALADSVAAKFGFGGFPGKMPLGIDSATVVKAGLVYLVSKKSPLAGLIGPKFLGLDSADVRVQILVLIREGGIAKSDSSILFPPPPVRVKTAISLEFDSVYNKGAKIGVKGEFEADLSKGIGYLDVVVLDSNDVVDTGVTIPNIPQPNGQAVYSLAGKVYLRADGAKLGRHTLVVTALDRSRAFYAESRKSFLVLPAPPAPPAPDEAGPAIEVVAPGKLAVLVGSDTTSYLIKVKATDTSGVASVSIGDSVVTAVDGVYSRTVQLTVYGQIEFVIKSTDSKNNVSTVRVYITRKPPEGSKAPSVTLLNPASSLSLPFGQKTVVLSWVVTDTAGIKSVDVNRQLLTSKNDTFSMEVAIPPSGDTVEYRLFAINKILIGTENVVKVVRAKDASAPVLGIDSASWLKAGVFSGDTLVVPTASSSVSLKWQASDNHYVSAVTLNGDTLVKGSDSLYTWNIPNLPAGVTKATVIATDSTGNSKIAYAKLLRMDRVTIAFSLDSVFVDAGVVKAVSPTPGAVLEYSLDGKTWIVLPEAGIPLSSSASIQFRGRAPGFTETIVTKNYVVKITPPPEAVGAVWNEFNWDDKLKVWQ
jgi:hypothetical protein